MQGRQNSLEAAQYRPQRLFFLGAVGVGPVDLEVGAGVRGSSSAL